jgi:hypothetical protein
VEPLAEGLAHGVLDRREERGRHRPELHLQPEPHPGPGRRRLDPQPDGGEERVRVRADDLGGGAGPDRPFDAQGGGLAERHLQAVVAGQGGLDDLLLDLAVQRHRQLPPAVVLAQADQRVLLVQLGERDPQGRLVARAAGDHDRLQGRPGERRGRRGRPRLADHVADLDGAQPPDLGDLPGGDGRAPDGRAAVEHADGGDPPLRASWEGQPVPDADRAREHPHVGDLLTGRSPFDLVHRARHRAVGAALGRRQQLGDPGQQRLDAGAGDRRAEEHRVHQPPPGLGHELTTEPAVGECRLVVDPGGQHGVVMVGEQLGQPGRERPVGGAEGREPGPAHAEPGHRPHRDDRRRQPLGDIRQHGGVPGAEPVDLVHEQQRGDAQPPQRPHQHQGLRLHALDGREHQHHAVKHVQHPFHLGDEVRVAGGVDQVDGDVADDERHHRRLDGDAALAFQLQRVGLGAAVIDAADLADDAGGEQQPFGEGGLPGVDMRQNS